jgi:2-succinyl-5-enolpyruvyl-6-hydroxy-3-cyclohexene-1-carboxylate synthase
LGLGAALPDRPLVAILGDTTFYHDMNGLLAIQRCGIPIVIVLLNNDGGGIFKRLPIRQFEPYFTDLFVMSHGLDFAHVAHLYGLTYHLNLNRREFQRVLNDALATRQSCLIEVQTQIDADFEMHQQMMKLIGESMPQPLISTTPRKGSETWNSLNWCNGTKPKPIQTSPITRGMVSPVLLSTVRRSVMLSAL